MDKDIVSPILWSNEAVALVGVEKLDSASGQCSLPFCKTARRYRHDRTPRNGTEPANEVTWISGRWFNRRCDLLGSRLAERDRNLLTEWQE